MLFLNNFILKKVAKKMGLELSNEDAKIAFCKVRKNLPHVLATAIRSTLMEKNVEIPRDALFQSDYRFPLLGDLKFVLEKRVPETYGIYDNNNTLLGTAKFDDRGVFVCNRNVPIYMTEFKDGPAVHLGTSERQKHARRFVAQNTREAYLLKAAEALYASKIY